VFKEKNIMLVLMIQRANYRPWSV